MSKIIRRSPFTFALKYNRYYPKKYIKQVFLYLENKTKKYQIWKSLHLK